MLLNIFRQYSLTWVKRTSRKRNTPEGRLDKNAKPLKFFRDIDSDWVVQNDKPHYGLKEHVSVVILFDKIKKI